MAATYGITATGFQRPRLIDIQTQIQQSLISTFGAGINLNPESVFGQLTGVFSEREDLLWQAMEDTYNSQYPDTAFGASLDNVGALSGIPRLGAQASTLQNVRLFGTVGTLVPAGTQLSVDGSPTSIFTTDADTTLIAGQDTLQTITFSATPDSGQWSFNWNGQEIATPLAFNAAAADVQAALQALPFATGALVTGSMASGFAIDFAGVSGLQGWPAIVVDQDTLAAASVPVTAEVTITQAGVEQGDVNVTATATGPVLANAGTLTVIVTPVSGLNSTLNITDAVVGRDTETDNAYRARREETLQVAGAGTPEAIRSQLLNLTGVTAAIVFENVSDIIDSAGRPPHSFEAVVQGGDDQAIIDLLWKIKPAGIQPVSSATGGANISGTALDSMGQPHPISFSRPTPLLIYVKLVLTINSSFPANGAAAAAQNIVNSGNALGIGKEVVVIPYLIASIATIVGIETAQLFVGLAANPGSSANIEVAINQLAEFDTSRVQVIT